MFSHIKFHRHPSLKKGKQAILDFGEYKMSVVCTPHSYGGDKGLYEVGLFKNNEMIEIPGITKDGDTVQGWLGEEDIVLLLEKMCKITKMDIRLVLLRSAFRSTVDGR
jgi:hypothetical protein